MTALDVCLVFQHDSTFPKAIITVFQGLPQESGNLHVSLGLGSSWDAGISIIFYNQMVG